METGELIDTRNTLLYWIKLCVGTTVLGQLLRPTKIKVIYNISTLLSP